MSKCLLKQTGNGYKIELNLNSESDFMGQLFTIGHSTHDFDYFAHMLKNNNINYLLDVRSTPYSKYAETYNRENLAELLEKENITYSYMGKYFGARQNDRELYHEDGYLDFSKTARLDFFVKAMKNVILGLEKGNNIALMCTEKDPIDCHRAIMVARAFAVSGVNVNHILADGSLQNQAELDERLLNMYFPDRAQVSIFSSDNDMTDEEMLKLAYKKRNAQIGYHLEEISDE